jgi:hypothetical protein
MSDQDQLLDLAAWLNKRDALEADDVSFNTIWKTALEFYQADGDRGLNLISEQIYGALANIHEGSPVEVNLINCMIEQGPQIRTADEVYIAYWLFKQAGAIFTSAKTHIDPDILDTPLTVTILGHFYAVETLKVALREEAIDYVKAVNALMSINVANTSITLLMDAYRRLYFFGDTTAACEALKTAFDILVTTKNEAEIWAMLEDSVGMITTAWLFHQVLALFQPGSEYRSTLADIIISRSNANQNGDAAWRLTVGAAGMEKNKLLTD